MIILSKLVCIHWIFHDCNGYIVVEARGRTRLQPRWIRVIRTICQVDQACPSGEKYQKLAYIRTLEIPGEIVFDSDAMGIQVYLVVSGALDYKQHRGYPDSDDKLAFRTRDVLPW